MTRRARFLAALRAHPDARCFAALPPALAEAYGKWVARLGTPDRPAAPLQLELPL